jgi:hypothetical protein
MFAQRLEVRHHDERVTVYDEVYYWLWRDGVSILDADGQLVEKHVDVLYAAAS